MIVAKPDVTICEDEPSAVERDDCELWTRQVFWMIWSTILIVGIPMQLLFVAVFKAYMLELDSGEEKSGIEYDRLPTHERLA